MKMRTRRLLCGVLPVMLSATACIISNDETTGETRTESKTVPLGGAKSVRVEIDLGAGELKVAGGASDLLNADFSYNVARWRPEVRYDSSNGEGRLTIQQPSASHSHLGNTHYAWDLRLSDKVPMEMSVEQGAGRADLNLAGLALTKLDVSLGAGETTIDLDGNWKHDLTASIHGGVGKATLHLPRDVGVRVTASGGLGAVQASGFSKDDGAYVNEAYGKSPVTLRIDVQGGVGEIDLELGGGQGTV